MFEKEKQIIVNNYAQSLYRENSELTLLKIINLQIPDAIKKFFVEEIESKFAKEFNEFKKVTDFNFDLPEAQPHLSNAFVLIKKNKVINKEEFCSIFFSALNFNLEYLLKPYITLTNFLYDFYDKLNAEDIIKKLNYVILYDYLIDLLKIYIERAKIKSLTKVEFLDLIKKLDIEYCKDFSIVDHYNNFRSFKEFLHIIKFDIESRPEAEAFELYLRGKELPIFSELILRTKHNLNNSNLSFMDYIQSVHTYTREKITLKDMNELEKSESKASKISTILNEDKPISKKLLDDITIPQHLNTSAGFGEQIEEEIFNDLPQNIKIPTEETFNKSNLVNSEIIKEENLDISKVIFDSDITKSKEMIEIHDHQEDFVDEENEEDLVEVKKEIIPENTPTSTAQINRNLDNVINNRLRKKVISKLLNGNEIYFNEFIDKMNSTKDWEEASNYLAEMFQTYNIDPYSSLALKFTDFLYENIR